MGLWDGPSGLPSDGGSPDGWKARTTIKQSYKQPCRATVFSNSELMPFRTFFGPGNIPCQPNKDSQHPMPKSREILMFVCLQKDAKQCCDAAKLDRTHCAGQ